MARCLKSWDITAGGTAYAIRLYARAVEINGTSYVLKQLPHVTKALFLSEFRLPIEGADVRLSCEMTNRLAVDGRIFGTDQPYEPLGSLPAWVYVFLFLNLINFFMGVVLGALLMVLGMAMTLSVARRQDLSVPV